MTSRFNVAQQRASFIQARYIELFGRLPDSIGFHDLFSANRTLHDIDNFLRTTPEAESNRSLVDTTREQIERHGKAKNLLIFGAYGNGNLGDAMMASLVAGDIERRWKDVAVFAFSDLNIAPYEFFEERKIASRSSISFKGLNRCLLAQFDGLFIGGGGLLAYPHDPLWNGEWAHLVPVPYALLACGVANPLPSQVESLVKGAALASARDDRSVEALAAASAPILCPDPVLALTDFDVAKPDMELTSRSAYVLRGPLRPMHEEIRRNLRAGDRVIGMEIAVDWPLLQLFPAMQFARTASDLQTALVDADLVFSERYHGAVFGLGLGKKTYGLVHPDHNRDKLMELFRSIGAEDWCGSFRSELPERFPHGRVAIFLERARHQYRTSVDQAITALLQAD